MMEVYALCVTIGMLMVMCAFGIGVVIGSVYERERNDDSDLRIYKPRHGRNRGQSRDHNNRSKEGEGR